MSTTSLSGNAVLQQAYDPATESIKVLSTANISGSQELIISAEEDSIKIGDGGGQFLAVNPDGSINVNTTTEFPASVGTLESGTMATAYNEVLSVASAVLTTIVSYIAVQPTRLKMCEVSGSLIGEYTVFVNGSPIHKKRTSYGNFDNNFQFSKGYSLVTNDIVSIKVLHTQASVGDFSGFILVLKD